MIPVYFNVKTFKNIGKVSSISLIEDLKNHIFYILKDNLSDRWNDAISDGLSGCRDIENFLIELKSKSKEKIAVNADCGNFKYFKAKLGGFFSDNGIIDSLHLELNYKCNLKCRHCFNPKNMDGYSIAFGQAKNIIDEACKTNVCSICLTGGECTINNDFFKIAEYAREKRLALLILTNGQRLFDDNILFNELLNIYPSLLKISLYSMNPHVHDFITGVKGSQYKTLNVIKRLRDKNVKVHIASPMLSYNADDYKEVKKFADETGASFSTGCNFIYNKNNNNLQEKSDYKDIEKFYRDTSALFPDSKRREFKKSDYNVCNAGNTILSIKPNLDITPCTGFNYILGNYNTTSLKELQENILPEFRKKFIKSNLKECFKYDYCRFCRYCALQSAGESGFMKKSKTLCEDAEAYYNAYLKL